MLQVMKERCGQCLFSKDAVVDNETSETPLMRVLREVGEEVERAAAQVERQCTVTAWNLDGRRLGTTTIDGRRVLDEVAERTRRPEMVGRITITNEAHGCAWTWEAGA